MHISELIRRLEAIKESHGDLEVYYFPYDWITPEPLEALAISDSLVPGLIVLLLGSD